MKHASLLAAVIALGLAGCSSVSTGQMNVAPVTPLSQYVLQVEPGIDRIALAVHDQGLSANQHQALRGLVSRFVSEQASILRIESPSGNDPAAAAQAYAMRDAMQAMGVPGDMIQVVGYDAPDARAPVLAGFETLRAHVPDCSAEPRNLGSRFSNLPTGGFGCAVTANMAAQIANPRDILTPRELQPSDSGRAAVVFALYRQGKQTAAPQEILVAGRISEAVE
ncbi:CpaD family pilus assembly protein [Brevundimonas sp.]|uniref:CpaD family pilus assembly protein n=1 Tax=Brevundimonas sp. TaxID=1871086 RepID=UPI0035B26574